MSWLLFCQIVMLEIITAVIIAVTYTTVKATVAEAKLRVFNQIYGQVRETIDSIVEDEDEDKV